MKVANYKLENLINSANSMKSMEWLWVMSVYTLAGLLKMAKEAFIPYAEARQELIQKHRDKKWNIDREKLASDLTPLAEDEVEVNIPENLELSIKAWSELKVENLQWLMDLYWPEGLTINEVKPCSEWECKK